jgi:hypothetical protein
VKSVFNPSNAKLNPICHLLALLGAHHILHVSRIRVNQLTATRIYLVHFNKYTEEIKVPKIETHTGYLNVAAINLEITK